ncbi:DNA-binding LacI/PurR family transcriptional regulator [Paenibacillus shirakamiensis]|uniref:DNA-binding LacI/PurR family transcriptional regulator n=1 Tax=Paenibacillus shirakamiensis TaxID=1265935 RepID=A0ABS4JCB9_9BACL|nr:LacI family DNA-binding transcriptional regulator [Paenibacillus shirakamiensis]MBP1999374.1 DNA-binding LacI/PurR family transcriptional regulator [Paenibacillus shirakamiensis]
MKVSIFDVAKKSGLSVVTVSRVLNNASTVREKNREKVLKAMKDLNYQPNAAARSLARGKTGIIGLTLSTLHDSFFDAVVKEISDDLAAQGYVLALTVITGKEESIHRLMFEEDRVDGVILLSPMNQDDSVRELQQKNIPFIILDHQHPETSVSSVIVDNVKGGYEATRHLIDLGHRDIAHITGGDSYLSSREREKGFRLAMKDASIEPFAIEKGHYDVASGHRIAMKWMNEGKMPTAVFASDDYIALGFIDACKNVGVRVPEEVSIIGFDDQVIASEFTPHLTTMKQPAELMARHGVELLLNELKENSDASQTLLLDPELMVRQSTGRPPDTDSTEIVG